VDFGVENGLKLPTALLPGVVCGCYRIDAGDRIKTWDEVFGGWFSGR